VHRRVLAIALALAVAACGGSASSPTGSGAVESPLPAGTHTSTLFQPAVTFTVPDGWVLATDSADYLQLRPAGQEIVGIHLFRGVSAASQDPTCPIEPQAGVGSTSSELVTWMRGLSGLVVSSPAMVTVGGLRGVSVDIAIASGWTQSCPFANGLPTVPLLVESGTGLRWVVAGGERLRLYLLDLPDGGTLLMDIDDFGGSQIDALMRQAAPIIRSMTFATG
jgi:hypothetical protein